MGRAIRAIQTRDLPTLFSFFGLQTKEEVLESRREEISARFAVEVAEILRLCTRIRERERYQLFREALRVAYESALRRQVSATP
jgi:hypothetical protein